MHLFIRDPHSGLSRNDLCLGHTPRDCDELAWTQIDYSPNISFIHQMTDGKEIFVKIKAVNNGKYFDVSNVTLNVLTGFWKISFYLIHVFAQTLIFYG